METPTIKSTLLKQFDLHNESLNRSKDTVTKNRTIRKRLASFIETQFGKKDLRFTEIKPDFADQFHNYLIEEFNFSNNTAVTYVWMMGKIFRYASDNGINVPVDPSQYYSYSKNDDKSVNFLNQEQLDAIHNLELTDDTDLVRDLFLYSCYTGMSLEELKKVGYHNMKLINGELWYSLKRGESFDERSVPVPFFSPFYDIEDKYDELRDRLKSDLIFPGIGNLSTRNYLKTIQKKAKIPFDLQFETARYTFMTTVALKLELSLSVVQSVLGYTKVQNTKEYQRLIEINIIRAFNKWN